MVTYLIGTVHFDLKGPERLRKFLGFVRPSSICHESSEETAKQLFEERRKGLEAFLQMMNQPDPALKLTAMLGCVNGYEIWVPYQHQQEDNPAVNIYPLENHGAVQKAIECLTDQLGKENVGERPSAWTTGLTEGLRAGDLRKFQNSIDLAYFDSQAVASLQESFEKSDHILEKRDGPMEQKIREIAAKDAEGTTVAICGAAHIFGEHHNLYERLKYLSPCRIRLPEIDRF